MAYTVYFRDRRTGERIAREVDHTWDKEDGSSAFWWRDGNASCDCNRSLYMYDWDESKELGCSSQDNVIVIEKIVNDGEVVYRDEVAEIEIVDVERDKLAARFLGASAQLCELRGAFNSTDENTESVIAQMQEGHDMLQEYEQAKPWLEPIARAIAAAKAIVAAFEGNADCEADLKVLDDIADQYYSELANVGMAVQATGKVA